MKIYNSLTFQKEEFKTIKPNEVLMYVCGPTVYDSPHLGHAKSAVAFDLMRRYLKHKGHDVKLVKNYTDIDDKIIKRANERGMDINSLSEQYIKDYEEIMHVLNIEKDFCNPRATEVIDFMIEIIIRLIEKGNAYESNGSVYFDVSSFPQYKTILLKIKEGALEEEQEEQEEQEEEAPSMADKRHVKDFALWKKSKEGEPFWKSPWGMGRPGWHIECTAMTIKYLGETIDIHGGGQDLKFPHHRNEIAQSESYTGKVFANYFMHNGFVNVDNEKMSKSLGNFFMVRDVIKEYEPMVVRFFLLSSHYRKSINYNLETMTQAKKNYEKLYNTIEKINSISTIDGKTTIMTELISKMEKAKGGIEVAMNDDLNTPIAIAEILVLFKELNKAIIDEKVEVTEEFKNQFFDLVKVIDDIFGIFPDLFKELDPISSASTFDERGKIIDELMELISDVRMKLKNNGINDLSIEIKEKLRDLGIQSDLDVSIAGSFDKRGELIERLLELISSMEIKLKEEGVIEISDNVMETFKKAGIHKELELGKWGSFDKRGVLIDDLVEFIHTIRGKLKKKGLIGHSNEIKERLRDLDISKELDISIAGSFDKRGIEINNLVNLLTDARSTLREMKQYAISDEIRERLKSIGFKLEDD